MPRLRQLARGLRCLPVAAVVATAGCARPQAATGTAAGKPVQTSPPKVEVATVRAELANLLKSVPEDPAAHVEMAMLELRSGNGEAAERHLRECWARFRSYARAPYNLGLYYLEHGREREAIAPLVAATALSPADASAAHHAAHACLRVGRISDAKRYAAAALKIDPGYADTYLLLARVYDAHGTAAQAISYVDKYLLCSPKPAPGYYLKGRLYARQASREKAEEWLRKAVDAEPGNAEFWTALGRVYFELLNATRAEEGLRCFEKALEADPTSTTAHRYYGQALLNQRRYAEAIPHLQEAVARFEDPGPVLYDLGQAQMKSGRTDEGKRTLELYRRHQEFARGATKLMEAVSNKPGDRRNHHALIRYCLDHRRYGAAKAAITSYRAQFGDDAAIRELEQRAIAESGGADRGSMTPGGGPFTQERPFGGRP